MSFLISVAHAADTAAPAGAPPGGEAMQFIMLAAFAAIFYFMIWRPQAKRAREHKELCTNLQKGDEVVTSGGICGKVVKVVEDFVVIEVSDTVELKIQRNAVAAALPKGTLKGI